MTSINQSLSKSIGTKGKSLMAGLGMLISTQLMEACKSPEPVKPVVTTPNGPKPTIDRVSKEKDLNNKLSLKSNSEISIMFIYLGYEKDKKIKMEDAWLGTEKNQIESNMNLWLSNIINNTKINDGIIELDGSTNRKVNLVNSELMFTDDEIKTMPTSAANILNYPKIRKYIAEENFKRIENNLSPIINISIIVGPEIYIRANGGLLNSSVEDGLGLITPYTTLDQKASINQKLYPAGIIHELFRHMISGNHQNTGILFSDGFKYVEGLTQTNSGFRSVFPYSNRSSGNSTMLEDGISKLIYKNPLGKMRFDTTNLIRQDGSKFILDTNNPLYNGNNNRKLRENKHNLQISKYISAYVANQRTLAGGRKSYETCPDNIMKSGNIITEDVMKFGDPKLKNKKFFEKTYQTLTNKKTK